MRLIPGVGTRYRSGMNLPASRHIKSKERVTATGLFSSDIKNMDDLFVHTLRDIYYAEKQIVKSLPEMIEKASNQQLKQGFQTHLRETENHVKARSSVRTDRQKGAGHRLSGDRRHHRRSRGRCRRSPEQIRPRCRAHRCRAGGRAL